MSAALRIAVYCCSEVPLWWLSWKGPAGNAERSSGWVGSKVRTSSSVLQRTCCDSVSLIRLGLRETRANVFRGSNQLVERPSRSSPGCLDSCREEESGPFALISAALRSWKSPWDATKRSR
eukprot:2332427-Amphidinium_carterae.1